MKNTCVDRYAKVGQFVLDRGLIMGITVFDFLNQIGHQSTNNWCGFKLISTGADCLVIGIGTKSFVLASEFFCDLAKTFCTIWIGARLRCNAQCIDQLADPRCAVLGVA